VTITNGAPSSLVTTINGVTTTKTISRSPTKRLFVRVEDLKEPTTLARILNDILQTLYDETVQPRSLPFASVVWFQGLNFIGGTPLIIRHQLGRPYQGYWATRVQSAGFFPVEQSIPTGMSSSQVLSLQTATNCTVDLVVF
jgi:hypothetical protein